MFILSKFVKKLSGKNSVVIIDIIYMCWFSCFDIWLVIVC